MKEKVIWVKKCIEDTLKELEESKKKEKKEQSLRFIDAKINIINNQKQSEGF